MQQCPSAWSVVQCVPLFLDKASHVLCAGRKVVSADTRIVKVWGANDGAPYTSIEPPGAGDINDVCVWPNSGCAAQGLGGVGSIAGGWRVRDSAVMVCTVQMSEPACQWMTLHTSYRRL